MSELVRIMNTTQRALRGRYNGAAIVLQPAGHPGSWEDVTKAAAEYHKGNWLDQVQVIDTSGKSESYVNHNAAPKTYWVANTSGDPEAPEFFEETYRDKSTGEDRVRKVRNPTKQPVVFEARLGRFNGEMQPGTWSFRGDNGQMRKNDKPVQVTLPGKVIKIPPYKRVEVSETQFVTLLSRDSDNPEHQRGQVIASRPPSDFEPDLGDPYWTVNRYRLWLEQVPGTDTKMSGEELMGPSEEDVRAANAELNEDEMNALLSRTRFDLWALCTLRAQNPAFDIPTKSEFQMAEARKAKPKKTDK